MSSARFDKKVVRLRIYAAGYASSITCVYSFVQVHADLLVSHSYGTCMKKVLQKTSSDVVLGAVDVSPASRVKLCAVELASDLQSRWSQLILNVVDVSSPASIGK